MQGFSSRAGNSRVMTSNEPEPTTDTFRAASCALDWPLALTAAPLLPTGTSDVVFRAVIGSVFRSHAAAAIYSDLRGLYLPGLLSLGVDAEISKVPEEARELGAIFQDTTNASPMTALYKFEGEPIPLEGDDAEPSAEPDANARPRLADEDAMQTVAKAGVLREVEENTVRWEDAEGQSHTASFETLREEFSRTVRLKHGSARGTRRAAVAGAVQRAVVFALAYPDRFVTDAATDEDLREEAAQFLREAAGKQRDPISLRWRQAAERFEEGRVAAALDRLYDSVLRGLSLPQPVLQALAWPRDSLSNMERRELIYLARAGNRDLKILAARRLEVERWAVGVRQTLDELTQFPDPLVRAAAKSALTADTGEDRR